MKTFRQHSCESSTCAQCTGAAQTPHAAISDREPFEERHYSVQQLAHAWNLSSDFVRRLFCNEPGVTEWVQQQRGRRRYRVIRIPHSVAVRVYRRALATVDSQHRPLLF